MSQHKLTNLLDNLNKESLEEIYALMWKDGYSYSKDDLAQHIRSYTIMFYKMASYSQSAHDKCYYMIKELEYRLKNKS